MKKAVPFPFLHKHTGYPRPAASSPRPPAGQRLSVTAALPGSTLEPLPAEEREQRRP